MSKRGYVPEDAIQFTGEQFAWNCGEDGICMDDSITG